eukprot:gene14949-16491_t
MFLASCIVFGYVFHLRVQEFKLYQIVLRVNRKDSLKLQFPSLTICDTDLPGDPKSPNESLPKNCEVNQLNNTADHFLLNDCKQFMTKVDISCSYGGRSICRFPKNFTAAHSWKRCNTFNYKGNIVQPVPGRYGGLHLLMFKNSSMAHITDNEENPFQETTRGLQLQIHAPNTSANQVFANQIPLTPGYQVQVKLQKKVFTRLPAPFPSKCSSKTSVKQLVRGKYTTSNCKFSCFMERMYTHCGGILPKFRGIVPENEYPNTEKYKDENTLFDCISKLYTTQGVQEFKLYEVRLRVNRKDSLTLPFPSLTICDTDLLRDPKTLNKSLPKNCEVDQLNNTADHFLLNDCKQFMSKIEKSCSYGGSSSCRFPTHFTPAHSWKQCYTFNYNGTIVQRVPGRFGGLHLLMFKNSSMPHTTDNQKNPFQETTRGLQLQIQAANTSANQLFTNPIPLTPGYQVQVKLQKKVYKRMPAPFPSKCSNETSVKQLVRGKYTTSNCKFSCILKRMHDQCGGILRKFRGLVPENEYPNTEKFKDEDTLFDCVVKLYTTYGFVNCDCPISCEEELFESQVTLTPWQKSSIVKQLHPKVAKQLGMREDEVNLPIWRENIVLLTAHWLYNNLLKRSTKPVDEELGEAPVTMFKQKDGVTFKNG